MKYKNNQQAVRQSVVADKIHVGVCVFILCALAYWKVLDYVPTTGTSVRYILALLPVLGLLWSLWLANRRIKA